MEIPGGEQRVTQKTAGHSPRGTTTRPFQPQNVINISAEKFTEQEANTLRKSAPH
jgi:hypothetical protein